MEQHSDKNAEKITFTDLGDDNWFLQYLDRIQITSRLLTTHDHLTKGPFPKNFEEFKVLESLQIKQNTVLSKSRESMLLLLIMSNKCPQSQSKWQKCMQKCDKGRQLMWLLVIQVYFLGVCEL